MIPLEIPRIDTELIWRRYSDNWVRHLGVVAEDANAAVRASLERAGYCYLDAQFIGPLSLLFLSPLRPSQLAASLGVSQAYATKLVDRLVKSGYSERVADASDRRARVVQLSCAGHRLINAALKELDAVSSVHKKVLGSDYRNYLSSLAKTGQALVALEGRDHTPPGLDSEMSAVVLSVVSVLVQRAVSRLNTQSGYSGLTIAHWRVIHDIGPAGSTTSFLAEKHELSTQAISRIVRELVSMGYIQRVQHDQDARVSQLIYTQRGFNLLENTANAIHVLGNIISESLTLRGFEDLCAALSRLHSVREIPANLRSDRAEITLSRARSLKSEFTQLVDELALGLSEPIRDEALLSSDDRKALEKLIKARLFKC